MNPKLYKIMKDVYAEFTGEELAEVIKAIRAEIQLAQEEKELNSKIIHLTRRLSVVKIQQTEL